ncbi:MULTISPECIES: sensor histidine kinase [unclassified Sphingomonas]|uniref:sensor histidine kinase n=1 Tax=unclassified Sphingomonas TaxID=196159 RepID=UPI0007370325|nr:MULTISPECIES: PAS domain-containing protein [unclassified Sphingomonas]
MNGETFDSWQAEMATLERGVLELSGADAKAALLELLKRDSVRRRQTEAELAYAQEWIQLAQEVGGVSAYSFDFERQELSWSPSTYALYGWSPDRPATVDNWLASIHPDDLSEVQEVAARALEHGTLVDHEFRIVRDDGTVRWIHDRARVVLDGSNRATRLVGLNIDITEMKLAQATTESVAKESSHRLKNLLSVLQGLVKASLTGKVDLGIIDDIIERIVALGRSQDIFLQKASEPIAISELILSQVHPVVGDAVKQLSVDGPPVLVDTAAAQSLGMALYELATNACKHGALHSGAGHVSIAWYVDDDAFSLHWSEHQQEFSAPVGEHSGFGTLITGGLLERALRGKVTRTYDHTGLKWSIDVHDIRRIIAQMPSS